ncbi:MAG: hypothetical protein HQM02_08995, partial [Magnetococcales bacterium]|nr:hypothetical protein [Magnetococcales bacterium]
MSDPSIPDPATPRLLSDYLARGQWRFKEAVNRFNRESPPGPAGVFGGLFAFHWLRREIHPRYREAVLEVSRNPELVWFTALLQEAGSQEEFITRFMAHHDLQHPTDAIVTQWNGLGLFQETHAGEVRRIQRQQKNIALETGGPEDRQRMALVDALPARPGGKRFLKAGFIPRMACPQSCRHCMFVWRPPLRNAPDPDPLLRWINQHGDALLFTGGDLAPELPLFLTAIRTMQQTRSFAILLNGSHADSPENARALFSALHEANRNRPRPAEVLVQISFDEFHQEIISGADGTLRERIPVSHVANLLQAATEFPAIGLVLLHKQNRLNFSD